MRHSDEDYKRVTAWGFFGLQVLFAIPVIGFIALIICSIIPSNRTIKSFARSYFCILVIILVLIALVALLGSAGSIITMITEFLQNLIPAA